MKRQAYLLAFADLIFPIIGYFFYDWNLVYVAIFFVLDLFFNLILNLIKEIVAAKKMSRGIEYSTLSLLSGQILLSIAILIITSNWYSDDGFIGSFLKFSKTDWEFFLFFPIQGYLMYNFFYILPRKFTSFKLSVKIKTSWITLIYVVIMCILGVLVKQFGLHELSLFIILLLTKGYYDYRKIKQGDNLSFFT